MKATEKKYYIGQTDRIKAKATREIVDLYGKVSGDYNRIHFDNDYAKNTPFKKEIAHGLFCLGLISNLIGMKFPGEGSIFISEDLKYLKPVYINDEIEVIAEIVEMKIDKAILTINLNCFNQENILVMSGETVVKVLDF